MVPLLPTLSLRKNFAWTLLGNLAYAASQWIIIVILTKSGPPELVGRFALGLAIIGPIITLASLQLRSIQVTDAAGENEFGDYLALRLVMVLAALLVVGAVALFGSYRAEVMWVILWLGVARGIELISEVFLGLFQRHERMDLVSRSTILKAILSVAGFMTGYFPARNLVCGVIGLCVAWALVLVFFDLRWGRALASPGGFMQSLAAPGRLARLACIALPLAIGTVLASLEISIPRYFIGHHFGERELGIFAAIAYLTAIPTQAINALGQAASPKLAKLHAAGARDQFLRLLTKLVGFGLLIGVAGFVVTLIGSRTVLGLLYAPEYARQSDILIWLMAAAGITYGYIFLGTALNALRVFRPRVSMHLVTLSMLLPACHILGTNWGLVGVAWAVCASQVVSALCYLAVVAYCLRKPAEHQPPEEI